MFLFFRMYFLRHIKDFFKVTFKIDEQKNELLDSTNDEESKSGSKKLILTCIGIGFSNVGKPQI